MTGIEPPFDSDDVCPHGKHRIVRCRQCERAEGAHLRASSSERAPSQPDPSKKSGGSEHPSDAIEPPFISDPVDQRVALSRACRAYLDAEIRDPLLYATVLAVYDAADDLLATMDVEESARG
jgi:hypothetical protein